MHRVRSRAWFMIVFMLVLTVGMCFFLWEYATKASDWVIQRGSPHVYETSNVGSGRVLDRDGNLLLDTTRGRVYASDSGLRQASLHWLGDRNGFIRPGTLTHHMAHLTGYDPINGVYGHQEEVGELSLTISSGVQVAALNAMDGRKGTIAVYNYKTGQILCAVTTPTFDPDNVPDIAGDTSGIYEGVYLNRFLQSAYPPGSIFKIVTTAAALDCVENIRDLRFTCTGELVVGGGRVTCERAHGTLNLKNAFAQSCNCSFAQIALLIGPDKLSEYVQQFGILDTVSFDGVSSITGNFDLTDAGKLGLAWSAIGQYTDLINPVAFLRFLGAVAGGGEGAEPYLVERVTLAGEITYQASCEKTDRIMSAELAQTLREYMRNNVISIYGDGNFAGLPVCAKSGTSELGGGLKPNAMFAGFVDDHRYPLAFIVVVENGGYGASTCVPILSQVLQQCVAVMDGK